MTGSFDRHKFVRQLQSFQLSCHGSRHFIRYIVIFGAVDHECWWIVRSDTANGTGGVELILLLGWIKSGDLARPKAVLTQVVIEPAARLVVFAACDTRDYLSSDILVCIFAIDERHLLAVELR